MPYPAFFDIVRRLESISWMGHPLKRLPAEVRRELFRPMPAKVREVERKFAPGRKPVDRSTWC